METVPDVGLEQVVAVYTGLGAVRALRGEYEAAINAYEEAARVLTSEALPGVAADIADLQRHIGRAYEGQGNYLEAAHRLEAGLQIFDRTGEPSDSVNRARIFSDQGWVYYKQGKNDLALERTLKALHILEGSQLLGELASVYNRLPVLYLYLGEPEQARTYGEKGLVLRQQLGDSYGQARSYFNLGGMADNLGNWKQALQYYKRGVELSQKIGYAEGIFGSVNIGTLLRSRGDLEEAEQHFQQALRVARTLGPHPLGLALSELGELEVLQENYPQALAHLEESRRVSREMGVTSYLGEAQWRTAWAYLKSGDRNNARHWARQALELSTQTGNAENLGDSYRILGMLALEEGLLEEAESHLRESLQIFERLQFRHKMARSQYQLGKLYSRQAGRQAEARHLLQAALETFQALGAQPEMDKAQAQLERLKSNG